MGNFREFWEACDAWEEKISRARRKGRVGDMLVLADEAPVSAFRASAWIARQGAAQDRSLRICPGAVGKGLAIEPENLAGLRERACLQRLALQGRRGFELEMACSHYRAILQDHPRDAETWAHCLVGWRKTRGHRSGVSPMPAQHSASRRALRGCPVARRGQLLRHRVPVRPQTLLFGHQCADLMHLQEHLIGDGAYRATMEIMGGAVRSAAECEEDPEKAVLGAFDPGLSAGAARDAGVCSIRVQKEAVAVNRDSWFALDSNRQQF